MVKRDLDGVYFRVMRDGKGAAICWTDLVWEERIEFARKNNTASWLLRMIQIMNEVAWEIHEAYPDIEIQPVRMLQEKESSKTWLRNALFKITAEIRMVAEEHNIVCEKCE